MVVQIFNAVLYEPLLNGLIFITSIAPFGDLGISVIILTLLVKIILLPFSHSSISAQRKIREIEPEVKRIKEKYTDKQEQARKVMELYQKHSVNPFSGCLFAIVQLPVVIALYFVFLNGFAKGIDENLLYSFIIIPDTINFNFLGFIDMTGKSFFLAALAGVFQYMQLQLSFPAGIIPSVSSSGTSFKDEFARNFSFQMKYIFPIFVFFISYTISSAVALYWVVSNFFAIGQEFWVRRKVKTLDEEENG